MLTSETFEKVKRARPISYPAVGGLGPFVLVVSA